MGGRAQVGAGVFAALAFARTCDGIRNEGAAMRGRNVCARRDLRILLGQKSPKMAERNQLVT
ncbi:MAG TPA: hypothetical protein VK504_18270 [Vicinamibacterales bacterium]|nr:hypothetical protein [Vicinamibacterales bacterium]